MGHRTSPTKRYKRYNISVDSRSRDSKESCEYSSGKCLKVDRISEFLRNEEAGKFKLNEILMNPK